MDGSNPTAIGTPVSRNYDKIDQAVNDHPDNAAKYDKGEVKTIKERINRAAKKHGIEVSTD